jgi:hypothetical protein
VKTNGATPAETGHSMSAPPESEDPDFRVHAAWLAQVSEAADGRLAKQVPQQGDGSPSVSPSSLDRADCWVGEQVRLAPPSRRGRRRSGPIMAIALGCIFATALVAVIAIPPRLALFDSWRPPTDGSRTESGPLTSATPAIGNEARTPKLIIEPSLGVAGEPAPIGLSLRGGANNAIVIVRGLLPGMELSTGSAIAGDTWQLSAADLPYAWIAPPKDFVGSADLVAELRLPNAQIADRQTLHVKWTRPGQEREQVAPRQENEMQPPIGPPTIQRPKDRDVITAAPTISAEPPQGQIDREHGKTVRARGKNNLRRSVDEVNRRAPIATLDVGESHPALKGFWDWSR